MVGDGTADFNQSVAPGDMLVIDIPPAEGRATGVMPDDEKDNLSPSVPPGDGTGDDQDARSLEACIKGKDDLSPVEGNIPPVENRDTGDMVDDGTVDGECSAILAKASSVLLFCFSTATNICLFWVIGSSIRSAILLSILLINSSSLEDSDICLLLLNQADWIEAMEPERLIRLMK
jgi:hypothetical protein